MKVAAIILLCATLSARAFITTGPSAGGGVADLEAITNAVNGVVTNAVNGIVTNAALATDRLFAGTNSLIAPRGWNALKSSIGPYLMLETWNMYAHVLTLADATNAGTANGDYNISRLMTNATMLMATNGMKGVYWGISLTDGWQVRDGGGKLVLDPEKFPYTLEWLCDFMHSHGLKLFVYTSISTNPCGPVSSPIHLVFDDIQTLMSAGVDGSMFDNCTFQNTDPAGQTNHLPRAYVDNYYRIVEQAIDHFNTTNVVPFRIGQVATNGWQSFLIQGTGNYGDSNSLVTADMRLGVQTVTFQTPFPSSGVGSVNNDVAVSNALAWHNFMETHREFIGPGHTIQPESWYGTPGWDARGNITNVLALFAMSCAPIRGDMAFERNGVFPVANSTWDQYYAPWILNRRWFDIYQDPAVIVGKTVYSNALVRVIDKPLGSEGSQVHALAVVSQRTTNFTLLLTNSMWNGNAVSNTPFIAEDVWSGAITHFTNGFALTLVPHKVSFFKIYPAPKISADSVSSGILPLNRGGTGASLGIPGDHYIWGWDSIDNSVTWIAYGVGFYYDHSIRTLSTHTRYSTNGVAVYAQATNLNLIAGTGITLEGDITGQTANVTINASGAAANAIQQLATGSATNEWNVDVEGGDPILTTNILINYSVPSAGFYQVNLSWILGADNDSPQFDASSHVKIYWVDGKTGLQQLSQAAITTYDAFSLNAQRASYFNNNFQEVVNAVIYCKAGTSIIVSNLSSASYEAGAGDVMTTNFVSSSIWGKP